MTTALTHHGILGMKWGVRRTPEQLGHRTSPPKTRAKKSRDQKESEKRKRQDVKNRGTLSDADLAAKIKRLQMEKQLLELTESEVSAGRKYAKGILSNVGSRVISTVATGALLYGTKAALSKSFDLGELGNAVFNGGPKKK